jgi:hypothetical protein
MHDIFLITQKHDLVEYYTERFPRIKVFPVRTSDRTVTREKLADVLARTLTKYFYIIVEPDNRLPDFEFDFVPDEGEEEFVHTWNNSTNIRLYNRAHVLANIDCFTDDAMYKGLVNFKDHVHQAACDSKFDVVYLSYDETFADGNFERLLDKAPHARRVAGVHGIFNAHKTASGIVDTSMVYIVDADAEIKDNFEFDYVPPESDRGFAHVWRSVNPINGLEYGYGGIKLFPTKMLRTAEFWRVDFATSFSEGLKVMPGISNVSRFNTNAFDTWRSAFRECAKLASTVIQNQDADSANRLATWCTVGIERAFGTYALEGAKAGRDYGHNHIKDTKVLNCVNDYAWLRERFDQCYSIEFRYNRSQSLYNRYLGELQHRHSSV